MSVSRWKVAAVPLAILGLASPMLASCEALGGLPDPTGGKLKDAASAAQGCDEFKAGDFSSLKLDANITGFLDASAQFDKLVLDMEGDLIAACGELGKALGVPEGELKAEAKGGEGAKKVCGAVSAKLSATMKANAKAQLSVALTPPKCYADIDAQMKCFADCGSPVSPGEVKASCEGGEISGKCDGKCSGGCKIEAGAACKGTCSASCSGKCEAGFSGTCGGNCDGKCDGKNAKGKCAGTCEGKCDAQAEGSCSGTCDGKCSASCEVKGGAKCEGSCSGGCDVEMKAPKCSGEFKPPKVSLECQAQCAAKAAAALKCDPPGIKVVAKGEAGADVQKLIGALQTTLPKIAGIGMARGEAIAKAGASLAGQLEGAAKGVTSAGAKAAVCMATAVEAVGSATASVSVNVEASASVSGSATGSAGTK